MGTILYAEDGRRFRNTAWSWRSLWGFVAQHCDGILSTRDVEQGMRNDGHLIANDVAQNLAACLEELLDQGEVARYEQFHQQYVESLPLVQCWLCAQPDFDPAAEECYVCHGDEVIPSPRAWYSLTEENVRQFVTFCRKSGGFRIC